MRKLVSLLMALLLVLPVSVSGASAAGTPFVDVSSGAWYAGAVEYVYDEGLFYGTSPHPPFPRRSYEAGRINASACKPHAGLL